MKEYKYDAFISYRHLDKDKLAASKLQQMLENFKPPNSMGNKDFKKWKVFRDETELNSGSDLSSGIKRALEQSRFLIVVCTKETKESKWCMEEIEYFKKLHNGSNSNTITLVADGEPSEVFPAALLTENYEETDENGNVVIKTREIEPLAATITSTSKRQMKKKLKNEFLRIAAPIAGCGYDDLYNRAQKSKVKRFITIGALIALLMMCFGVYSSAMLLKISTQKEELLLANEELKKKTDELNKSNEELVRSYEQLAEKTKEAENNYKEAEKQKNVAEDNLKEANIQKKKAEENLKEANRQKALAEENLKEATKQKNLAEENLKEANRQKALAEENLNEANRQKTIAKENEEEAVKQKNLAQSNEAEANRQKEIAQNNENEANRQKEIAQNNEAEANRQKGIAEENMAIAVANEKKAKEANDSLRKKNAEILASQAEIYYSDGDTDRAVKTAVEALRSGENGEVVSNTEAEKVLINATGVYTDSNFYRTQKLNLRAPVKQMMLSDDCSRILASDNSGNAYLFDTASNNAIKTWNAAADFGYGYNSGSIDDIYVEGNCGYILCNYHIMCIDMQNGETLWSHDDIGYNSRMAASEANPFILLYGYGEKYLLADKMSGEILPIGNENVGRDAVYISEDGIIYSIDKESSLLKLYDANSDKAVSTLLSPNGLYRGLAVCAKGDNIYVAFEEYVEAGSASSECCVVCIDKVSGEQKWKNGIGKPIYDIMYLDEISFNAEKEDGTWEKVSMAVIGGANDYIVLNSEDGAIVLAETFAYEKTAVGYYTSGKGSTVYVVTRNGVWERYILRKFDEQGTAIWDRGDVGVKMLSEFLFPAEKVALNISDISCFACSLYNSSEILLNKHIDGGNGETISIAENVSSISSMCKFNDDTIAFYGSKKVNNETLNYIWIMELKSRKIISEHLCELSYPEIYSIDGKILAISYEGYELIDLNSGYISKGKIEDVLNGLLDASDNRYISNIGNALSCDDKVIYVTSDGAFALKVAEGGLTAEVIYDVGKGLVLEYGNANCSDGKIICGIRGGTERGLACIDINAKKIELIKDGDGILMLSAGVADLTMSGNLAAYIDNMQDYIGITEIGSGVIHKINSEKQGISPEKLLLTPNGETLIVVCAGGKIIAYSTVNFEKKGEYNTGSSIYNKSSVEIVSDYGIVVNKQFIDLNAMKLKHAFGSGFMGFLNDSNYVCKKYNSNYNYDIVFYNWMTPEELVDKAEEMFDCGE